jgi:hypothetical protein
MRWLAARTSFNLSGLSFPWLAARVVIPNAVRDLGACLRFLAILEMTRPPEVR